MIVFDIVLWQVVDVLYSFLLQRINCDGFLEQRISFVLLVLQDGAKRCYRPYLFSGRSGNSLSFKRLFDDLQAVSRKEAVEDESHHLRLFGIDLRLVVSPSAIAEECFIAEGYVSFFGTHRFAHSDITAE